MLKFCLSLRKRKENGVNRRTVQITSHTLQRKFESNLQAFQTRYAHYIKGIHPKRQLFYSKYLGSLSVAQPTLAVPAPLSKTTVAIIYTFSEIFRTKLESRHAVNKSIFHKVLILIFHSSKISEIYSKDVFPSNVMDKLRKPIIIFLSFLRQRRKGGNYGQADLKTISRIIIFIFFIYSLIVMLLFHCCMHYYFAQ